MVGADTVVMSMQNGVESVNKIEAAVGPGHFVPEVSYVNSVIEEPGVIDQRFNDMTSFGELDRSSNPRIRQLTIAFERAGIKYEVRSDGGPFSGKSL